MAKIINMYFKGLICLEEACDGMRDLVTDRYINGDIIDTEAVEYFHAINRWGSAPTQNLEV